MGFSSTFVTDMGSTSPLPEWFVEKWQDWVYFRNDNHFPLSSKTFATVHRNWFFIEEDLQKAVAWDENPHLASILLVYMHECGGVTRVEIHKDHIEYHDPLSWRKVACGNCEHDYIVNMIMEMIAIWTLRTPKMNRFNRVLCSVVNCCGPLSAVRG